MSKPITDWIKDNLYPSLYESIDIALPEFSFKRKGRNWVSSNKRKVTGEEGDSIGKVYIYQNSPGYIKDFTRESLSIVDYVIKRDNIDFIGAVKKLSEIAKLQLPELDNKEEYISYKKKEGILEEANRYFIFCLNNSPGAEDINSYLSSRGYNKEDIEAMELGYIPSQDKLYKYLTDKGGYSKTEINEVLSLIEGIGSTHRLTIPYRSGGSLKGFKFRIIGTGVPKYLNSTGLDRSGGFFNLLSIKGDKDIVIVEGELDSLLATARGVPNIVATGGSSINREQVRDAIKKGAKSFTLCLDRDKTGIEAISPAIEVIRGEGIDRIYIATLPGMEEGKIDPDKFILEKGVEAFKKVISGALPWYEYELKQILEKYGAIQETKGELDPRDIDNLLEEVVKTGYTIQDPLQRDQYKKQFIGLEPIQELGITEESLTITVDRLTSNRNKEAQDKKLKLLLSQARDLQDRGDIDKALDLLQSNLEEVKLQDKKQIYQSLLAPTTEEEIRKQEQSSPGDIDTGYKIAGDEILLPGGAITVYAAATNHGKTLMCINTALNVAERYPDKKFIFFTYEERESTILQYFLNVFIDKPLNTMPYSNRRLIKNYFKTGELPYANKETKEMFEEKKQKFFKTYIETGRILIKQIDLNSTELSSAIKYINKQEPKLGGVFIDYFQLLNLPGGTKRINSRQEELKHICISIKNTAIDTGLPICLAAQFNREVNSLLDIHSTKLGEAGDIERIVNTLIALWDISKELKGVKEEDKKRISAKVNNLTSGLYVELLKSRDLKTGGYEVLRYNGNTGKITPQEIEPH
jgi:DNA primase catalytic core